MLSRLSPLARRVAVASTAALLILFYLLAGHGTQAKIVTTPVSRGSIVRAVTATGTVNPVVTVQVGSYVSGPIQGIYADFNSPVKKGQIIAKIDPRPFQVKVDESTAALANAKAQLGKDQADTVYKKLSWQRNRTLMKFGGVSRDQVDSLLSAYQMAAAQVELDKAMIQQQEANLHDAQVQLGFTDIMSPVDGTVVSRNVDVGQTVAASFQTPTLFLIAKDLTQMQVDSNVSESDIGETQVGQKATFRVDAYPDRDFEGEVSQVRQAPITVQNVVTYDVVVSVANPELLLRPGMTANLTITTARRDNVLRVPLLALRFHPDGARRPHSDHPHADRRAQAASGVDGAGRPARTSRVWVDDGGGHLRRVAVVTGLDDGTNVEVRDSELKEGQLVATDEVKPSGAAPASGASRAMHGPGGPGPRF